MADRKCTVVFGGTGFLGRRVAQALSRHGAEVRVATRHAPKPEGGASDFVKADITNHTSIAAALQDADAAVNCVSLYVETSGTSFDDIHVDGARNVAGAAEEVGARLVHVSGVGANAEASSTYVRSRGEGEIAVRQSHSGAVIVRPTVMFDRDDAFLSAISDVAAKTPMFPLFGDGGTRLQPVAAADVAEAIARLVIGDTDGTAFEFGGPEVLTYRQIVRSVLEWEGRRRLLVPVPFAAWELLARAAKALPHPPVTEGQIALMRRDNIAAGEGLSALGISPKPMRRDDLGR